MRKRRIKSSCFGRRRKRERRVGPIEAIGAVDSFRSFKDGYQGFSNSYKDKKFEGKRSNKEGDKFKSKDDVKCYNCQGFGHIARDCSKPQSGGRGRK